MSIHIRNIVFACPDVEALAAFYAHLLGMQVIRTDWFVIAIDENSSPRLAFDEEPAFKAPRLGDPENPQQLHLDILVHDLDAAEESVLELGATKLHPRTVWEPGGLSRAEALTTRMSNGDEAAFDDARCRTYADPAGHPFCLYQEAGSPSPAGVAARIGRVVFDCFSPRSLASFYSGLLDMPIRKEDSEHSVVISRGDLSEPDLGFQYAQFQAARWPDPRYPQQMHLDFLVGDGEQASALALRLGAIRLPPQGGSCPVFADPAAHPFCLCSPGQ